MVFFTTFVEKFSVLGNFIFNYISPTVEENFLYKWTQHLLGQHWDAQHPQVPLQYFYTLLPCLWAVLNMKSAVTVQMYNIMGNTVLTVHFHPPLLIVVRLLKTLLMWLCCHFPFIWHSSVILSSSWKLASAWAFSLSCCPNFCLFLLIIFVYSLKLWPWTEILILMLQN